MNKQSWEAANQEIEQLYKLHDEAIAQREMLGICQFLLHLPCTVCDCVRWNYNPPAFWILRSYLHPHILLPDKVVPVPRLIKDLNLNLSDTM